MTLLCWGDCSPKRSNRSILFNFDLNAPKIKMQTQAPDLEQDLEDSELQINHDLYFANFASFFCFRTQTIIHILAYQRSCWL